MVYAGGNISYFLYNLEKIAHNFEFLMVMVMEENGETNVNKGEKSNRTRF